MPWKVGAFLSGICAFYWVAIWPTAATLGWLAAALGVLLALAVRHRPFRLPLSFVAGILWAAAMAHWTAPPSLPWNALGKTWQARVRIESLPQVREGRARFEARLIELADGQARSAGDCRVQLSWRNAPGLRAGQLWQLPVRLKPVNSYRNPGSWDYARWLYHRGIRYRGYVAEGPVRLLGERDCCLLERLRSWLRDRLLEGKEVGSGSALLLALVIGDRSGLTGEMREVLSVTGTSHLVAISGLHVSLLAGLVGLPVAWGWRRSSLARAVPAPLAGGVAGLAAAVAYALLAGFGLPARRAVLMLGLALVLLWRRCRLGPAGVLALVGLIVVMADPMAVIEAGFWLSFVAVAAILALLPQLRVRPLWLKLVMLQAGISLALLPVLRWFDMPAAPLGLLVNLVAVPLFSLLLIPAALLATVSSLWLPWGEQMLDGVNALLSLVWQGLAGAEAWAPSFAGPVMTPLRLALLSLGVLWVLLAPGLRAKLPGLMLVLALQLPARPSLPDGDFTLDVLDVGQGLSAVVRTRGHVLVYDVGTAFPGGFNLADAVVLPWLRHQGIARIDRLVLSHGDKDHAGAAKALLRGISVDSVLAGEPDRVSVPARRCPSGLDWQWEGVRFRFVQPPWAASRHGNNASCVLLVSSPAGSLLLTGDAEAPVERAMIGTLEAVAPLSVVVAGHHGSATSSAEAFVQTVRAEHVIYSNGYRNPYRFPRPVVDRRWAAAGTRRWRTDGCGALHAAFSSNNRAVRLTPHVARRNPYWWPEDAPCELDGGGEAP